MTPKFKSIVNTSRQRRVAAAREKWAILTPHDRLAVEFAESYLRGEVGEAELAAFHDGWLQTRDNGEDDDDSVEKDATFAVVDRCLGQDVEMLEFEGRSLFSCWNSVEVFESEGE